MNTYIHTKVVIVKAIKNKQIGYYTIVEKDRPNALKIKAVSASGRGRGNVGVILKDGTIVVDGTGPEEFKIMQLIKETPGVQKKIDFVLKMMFASNDRVRMCLKKRGLLQKFNIPVDLAKAMEVTYPLQITGKVIMHESQDISAQLKAVWQR